MKSIYDTFELNNGVKIPCVAFGTYKAAEGAHGQVTHSSADIKNLKI